MNQTELLKRIAEETGYNEDVVENIYQALVSMLSTAMGKGERIACLPDLGMFTPKLRDNTGRNENSPRQKRKPHYYIQFKPSAQFEQEMFAMLEKT